MEPVLAAKNADLLTDNALRLMLSRMSPRLVSGALGSWTTERRAVVIRVLALIGLVSGFIGAYARSRFRRCQSADSTGQSRVELLPYDIHLNKRLGACARTNRSDMKSDMRRRYRGHRPVWQFV